MQIICPDEYLQNVKLNTSRRKIFFIKNCFECMTISCSKIFPHFFLLQKLCRSFLFCLRKQEASMCDNYFLLHKNSFRLYFDEVNSTCGIMQINFFSPIFRVYLLL